MKVDMDKDDIVVVTENHGGYIAGHCTVCKASGWIAGRYGLPWGTKHPNKATHLTHKKGCAMNRYARKQ